MDKFKLEISEQEAKRFLKPVCPSLDEKDHKLAQARYAYETIWEILHNFTLYVRRKEGLKEDSYWVNQSDEKITEYALNALKEVDDAWDEKDADEWWNEFINLEHFNEYIKGALTEEHCGDCTAVPATCSRCYAETMYKLPYTAWWNKHLGHALTVTANAGYREQLKKYNPKKPLRRRITLAVKEFWRILMEK
jgi:hypothetical protein